MVVFKKKHPIDLLVMPQNKEDKMRTFLSWDLKRRPSVGWWVAAVCPNS